MKSGSGLQIIGLGESLFDVFDDQTVLGGAPLNVAVCANQCLSASSGAGIVASRVGRDPLGRRLIRELTAREMDTHHIQLDSDRPTGRVLVQIKNQQPEYEICMPAAWDAMQFDRRWDTLAVDCDAVCFGTLAQRCAVSREAIDRFLSAASSALRLFDVNLRQDLYTSSIIEGGLQRATALKLNADELFTVAPLLDIETSNRDSACFCLREKYDLRFVALTLGAEGIRLYTPDGAYSTKPISFPCEPDADAVGAGDAAAAGLMIGFLNGWEVPQILHLAAHLGAYVASVAGATPQLPKSILDRVAHPRTD
jgi:fructokinase